MTIALRQLLSRKRKQWICEQKDFYEKSWTADSIQNWQLERFNADWPAVCRSIPHYRILQTRERLPLRFSCWKEFQEKVPPLEKKDLRADQDALVSEKRPPDYWRITGGSTGEPVRIPAWKSEHEFIGKDLWYGRSRFGVDPSDKLFLLWGHSHLLGGGLGGSLNGLKRQAKDFALGYLRFSVYSLSDQRLREAAEKLLQSHPVYVLGYSIALDRFARINRDRQQAFRKLRLKVAIATAESFPRSDSAAFISEVLGCPVAMEYGTVESGPVAYQDRDGSYSVFWRHHFVEGIPTANPPGAYEILVTTLYPRCFPLVRYRVGDYGEPDETDPGFALRFNKVVGRLSDFLPLGNGGYVHTVALDHAIIGSSVVSAVQIVQKVDGKIELHYLAERDLAPNEIGEIRQRLGRVDKTLADIPLKRAESLAQTVAGKTRSVLRQKDG